MGEKLLSAQEVADYLGVPLATLYQWRTNGTAPRAVKVGRYIRFRKADLESWCERNPDAAERQRHQVQHARKVPQHRGQRGGQKPRGDVAHDRPPAA